MKILIQNLTSFKTLSPKSDFYLVFNVLTEWWYLLWTLLTIYLKRRIERQCVLKTMPDGQLEAAWRQFVSQSVRNSIMTTHNFHRSLDRTLWSKNYSRSAVFLRIHLCENKSERSLVRSPSIFSNAFVWARRRRVIEKSWHLHSIYPILAAGRYLQQSWHLSKLTMPNRKSNLMTCAAQNIP